jgi:predicted Zn-dependent protease
MKPLAYLMLLTLPALNAQQTPGAAPGRGVNFYSTEKEAALGAQMASEFQRQNRILDDAQVNAYLESAGGRLLKQLPDTGFTFHFAVFADSEKGIHEPRVLPGAYVYVPESLILAARDEAEFAGMLAHAIAHAADRDATRQASRGELLQLSMIPLLTMGGWTGYAAQQSAAMPVGFLQFQRAFESQADYRAVSMMAGAGWDPEALARYIEREQPSAGAQMAQVFSALPPAGERVAAIRKEIGALPLRDYAASPQFAAIQAEVSRLDAAPKPAPPALNPPQQ